MIDIPTLREHVQSCARRVIARLESMEEEGKDLRTQLDSLGAERAEATCRLMELNAIISMIDEMDGQDP